MLVVDCCLLVVSCCLVVHGRWLLVGVWWLLVVGGCCLNVVFWLVVVCSWMFGVDCLFLIVGC